MRGQERKITTLVVAGLVAAIVCFGLLTSTGAVENPGYTFGGAFAGFLVTIIVLNRFWGPDTFEDQAAKSGAEMVYDEIVKVLDLRHASPRTSPQRARLGDYRRAVKTRKDKNFHLHYATTGKGIVFEGSATHPLTAEWKPGEVTHQGPDGQQLKRQYELEIPLGDVATNQVVPITIEVTYVDAFTGAEQEWLETHIDEPTRRLSMIVLAPEDMAVTRASVEIKKEGRGEPPPFPQPRVGLDGGMVFWTIDQPLPEARYALTWHWVARRGAPAAAGAEGNAQAAQ